MTKLAAVLQRSSFSRWALTVVTATLCGCLGVTTTSFITPSEDPLILYCAAGMKEPVEQIATEYQQRYGEPISIQYGGSGTLLSNLKVAGVGDLYLAADSSYLELAREDGLVAETIPVAEIRPVIAVAPGNPKALTGLEDLLDDGVDVALANPDAAAVGRISQAIFEAQDLWPAMSEQLKVLKPTVNEVATDIRLGAVDAGILWDSTASQFGLDSIPVADSQTHLNQVGLGVLSSSQDPTRALKFARFLAARDEGLVNFAEAGFSVVQGDLWEEQPEILIYSGSMLRPGLQEAVNRFQEREGVIINTVYNGCGILVSQMNAGQTPEAYVSCDVSFMDEVQDRFFESKILTENDMVILVQKGNPLGISGLEDLAGDGVRVGLSHPEKSALGALTKRMLEAEGLYESITANQVLDSATGDFLVNQIRVGSLDAVIVYRSNARANPENLAEHLALVEVDSRQSVAIQPYAVARDSEHQQLLGRFFATVRDAQSEATFTGFGFRWRVEDDLPTDPSGE